MILTVRAPLTVGYSARDSYVSVQYAESMTRIKLKPSVVPYLYG